MCRYLILAVMLASGCSFQVAGLEAKDATPDEEKGDSFTETDAVTMPDATTQADAVTVAVDMSCGSGFTLCVGQCVNLLTDKLNCAKCGNACGGPNNTDRSFCIQGVCGCDTSFQAWCTNTCRDVKFDPQNCGVCGNVCPMGKTCVNYTCQ